MVNPKKSSSVKSVDAVDLNTPSKIPRFESRKQRPSSDSLRAPTVPRTAVFDLNGRVVKKSSKDELQCGDGNDESEKTDPPFESLATSEDDSSMQPHNQHDGSITVSRIKTVSMEVTTATTRTDISKKQSSSMFIGDLNGTKLSVSRSQALFSCVSEEDNRPSSRCLEGNSLKPMENQCSFVNICEKGFSDKTSKGCCSWMAVWNFLITVMILSLLMVTVLVNYEQLAAMWYGYDLKQDFILPIEQGYYDKFVTFTRMIWEKIKRFMALDELDAMIESRNELNTY